MPVALTKSTMIAAHSGLNDAHRVGRLQLILAEGHRQRWAVAPTLTGLGVGEGGLRSSVPEMPLDSGTNQPTQLFVVHST